MVVHVQFADVEVDGLPRQPQHLPAPQAEGQHENPGGEEAAIASRGVDARPLYSVSVAGVVVREDGRLLAIRRAGNGTWELPGVFLELNEIPEAGVAREVWEETGIRVEVDQLTGVYKNTTRGIVALVFRCKPSGGTERTSTESKAVSWLRPTEVSDRMSEVYAIRLLDVLDDNGPHVRSHDGKQLTTAG